MNELKRQGIGSTSQRRRDKLVTLLQEMGIVDEQVLSLIATTPRHLFLEEAMQHNAYDNCSLPIGHKQTISQPYIVARMTELLLARSQRRGSVLEIGTGSGYQSSILSPLFEQVYSVERIAPLQKQAQARLSALGYSNIAFKLDDGQWGWPEEGPFDAIISAASPDTLPPKLLNQLAIGGCLVSPVGSGDEQRLICAVRTIGDCQVEDIEAVKFVPFLSGVVHE